MENIYKEMTSSLLAVIQDRLIQCDVIDDSFALQIIAETVFNYADEESQGSDFDYHELCKVIKKLFFKTRTKYNILKPLIDDAAVSEIMVNGPSKIFFEKDNCINEYDLCFDSEEELEDVMQAIAGDVNREINELNPMLDARLSDGSRVNGVYKNIAITGPTLTIRKFLQNFATIEQLIGNGTITQEAADLLKLVVGLKLNIFVSGGTSSGKTTLINAMGDFIEKDERVVIIEDSSELNLKTVTNLVQMECRNSNFLGKGEIGISDLIKTSLRMRPDRIIVGEVRGKEVFYMLQAMNTGHSGMSTGHGNSINGMLKRLETMYLMAASIDMEAIRKQIAEAIDIMIHVERRKDARKVVEISELVGYEQGEYILNTLMKESESGHLIATGNKIKCSKNYKTMESITEDMKKWITENKN